MREQQNKNQLGFVGRRFFALFVLSIVICFFAACAEKKQYPQPVELPPEPVFYEHVVSYSGETLGLIASWYTGRSQNWSLLLDANPGLLPERINIGDIILIPEDLLVEDRRLPESYIRRAPKADSPPRRESSEIDSEAKDGEPKSSEGMDSEKEIERRPSSEAPEVADDGGLRDLEKEVFGDSERVESDRQAVQEPVKAAEEVESIDEQDKGSSKPEEAASDDELEREKLLDELLGG